VPLCERSAVAPALQIVPASPSHGVYVESEKLGDPATGAELKIMQELLRHSTIRVTLDTYTQAVTTAKRDAREAVVALLFPEKTQET